MMRATALSLLLVAGAIQADMNDEPLLFSFEAHELELRKDGGDSSVAWDAAAWFGTTRDRLVLRSEGEADDSATDAFESVLAWSRAVSPYWNLNLGWRGDWQPEQRRSWALVEFEGLAPGFVDTRFSILAGGEGRYAARLELETEWRLARRLKLAPLLEFDWYRRADLVNERGSGLTEIEAGLRLKYVIRPDLEPYIGLSWARLAGDTADQARAAGQHVRETNLIAGLSFWF